MKTRKIALILISVIFFLVNISLFGCAKTEKENFFLDQIGREVEIDGVPNRIVSGYYVSTSVCIALGLSNKLVGVETGRENRPIYSLINNENINNAFDVGSAKNFDLEKCCQANPDLVILPFKAKNFADILEELNISVVVVNPETEDGFLEMVELIAKITNTENKAKQLTDYYRNKINFIENIVKNINDLNRPKVFMGSASGYLTTATKDLYQSYLIRLAGGKNCGDVYVGNGKVEVDKEQFISFNPDVIIIPTNAMANGYSYTAENYESDDAFKSVNAVSCGKIYYMPKGFEAWDSPTPSSILGALYVLNVLYPSLYSLDDFRDEVYYFYDTFYGVKIDKNSIN